MDLKQMDYFFCETVIVIELHMIIVSLLANLDKITLLMAFCWSSVFIMHICIMAGLFKEAKRSMIYNFLVPTLFNVATFPLTRISSGYRLQFPLWVAFHICFSYFFYVDYFKLETKLAADRVLKEARELDTMINDIAAADTSRRMKTIERDRALHQAFEVVLADPVCSLGRNAETVLEHIKSNYTAFLPEIVEIGDTIKTGAAAYRIRIFSDRFGNVAEILRG